MESYPVLEINTKALRQNAIILRKICRQKGIEPCAVIKGFCGQTDMVKQIIEAGYTSLGSSRIPHLKKIKGQGFKGETLLVRIPMKCELNDVIKYCDISLESEKETLVWLDEEARKQNIKHKVIIMRDLGDLREGVFCSEDVVELSDFVEKELKSLQLYGIGANLACYGSIAPTMKNLTELVDNAKLVEKKIGRKLDIISGGSTSSVPLVFNGTMPSGINHIRIGEAIAVPYDLEFSWDCYIEGMSNDVLVLKAQIVELNDKPTKPKGEQGIGCFGSFKEYEDYGVRRRAILALGEYDVGNFEKLMPTNKDIRVLGASSDHTIVDIQDSKIEYRLGDVVEFNLRYQSMLFTTSSEMITKNKK